MGFISADLNINDVVKSGYRVRLEADAGGLPAGGHAGWRCDDELQRDGALERVLWQRDSSDLQRHGDAVVRDRRARHHLLRCCRCRTGEPADGFDDAGPVGAELAPPRADQGRPLRQSAFESLVDCLQFPTTQEDKLRHRGRATRPPIMSGTSDRLGGRSASACPVRTSLKGARDVACFDGAGLQCLPRFVDSSGSGRFTQDGDVHQGRRADLPAEVRIVPSAQQHGADVAPDLRRGASVGEVDRRARRLAADAAVAHRQDGRHPEIQERPLAERRADRHDRAVGGRRRAEGRSEGHAAAEGLGG